MTKPVWGAARLSRLLIGPGMDIGRHGWYNRGVAPGTLSTHVALVPAKGSGTICTETVLRAATSVAAAYMALEEGPRMCTSIVDGDRVGTRIGREVTLVFKPTGGGRPPLPAFTLT